MKQYVMYSKEGLVPVSEEVYLAYYQMRSREKYLIAREQGKIISLDKAIEDGIPLEQEISRNEENLEDVIIRQLMIEKMMSCLPQLPEYDRLIIAGLYHQAKSMRELARELGVSEGSIRYRHKRALVILKNILENS